MAIGVRIRTFLDITTMIVSLAAAVVLLSTTARRPAQSGARQVESVPTEVINLKGAATKGDHRARLGMVVFSDFECPYCGKFARDTWPTLDRLYVQTGRLLVAFRHMPLESIHRFAFKAAEGAECAARQGAFWPFHDALFASRDGLDEASLLGHATTAGLDIKAFGSCLQGETTSRIRYDIAEAQRLGLGGTPRFLVGNLEGSSKAGRRIPADLG